MVWDDYVGAMISDKSHVIFPSKIKRNLKNKWFCSAIKFVNAKI